MGTGSTEKIYSIKKLVSVEAKMNNMRKVAEQSLISTWFDSRSYAGTSISNRWSRKPGVSICTFLHRPAPFPSSRQSAQGNGSRHCPMKSSPHACAALSATAVPQASRTVCSTAASGWTASACELWPILWTRKGPDQGFPEANRSKNC